MRIHNALGTLVLGSLASAQVLHEQRIAEGLGGFPVNLPNGAQFGARLAALGDLDGDGIVDLAVGEPQGSDGFVSAGAVWILFLNANGTVRSYQKISATQGGFTGALGAGSYFGSGLALLDDLDGDGVRELAVGADGDGQGGYRRGAVFVLFLRTDGTVRTQTKIASGLGGFTGTLDNSDRFGGALAQVGDIDDDGKVELAVGARQDDDAATDTGAVYLLSLNPTGTVATTRKLSATSGGLTFPIVEGDELGGGLGALGDWDGDGTEDLAVGMIKFKTPVTGNPPVEEDSGSVILLRLNPDGTQKSFNRIHKGSSGFTPGHPGALFGSAILLGEDYDGDGVRDLLVGSSSYGAATVATQDGNITGALWLLYMNADGTVRANLQVARNQVGFTGPIVGGDAFGCALALIGDADGNGKKDVAVGARGADVGGLDAGAVWELSLRAGTANAAASMERTGAGNLTGALLFTTTGTGFTVPRLGGTSRLRALVDADHNQTLFFGFDTKVTLPVPGGWTLLCVDGGAGLGEIFTGSGMVVNKNANNQSNLTLNFPNNGALVGFAFTVQALLLDSTGANLFSVTNAWDITIGL